MLSFNLGGMYLGGFFPFPNLSRRGISHTVIQRRDALFPIRPLNLASFRCRRPDENALANGLTTRPGAIAQPSSKIVALVYQCSFPQRYPRSESHARQQEYCKI